MRVCRVVYLCVCCGPSFYFQLYIVSRIQQGRQGETSIRILWYPRGDKFLENQSRALSYYRFEEMKKNYVTPNGNRTQNHRPTLALSVLIEHILKYIHFSNLIEQNTALSPAHQACLIIEWKEVFTLKHLYHVPMYQLSLAHSLYSFSQKI